MKHKKLSILIFIFLIAMLSLIYFTIENKKVSGNTTLTATNSIDTNKETISEATNDLSLTAKTEIPEMPILMYHYIRALDDPNDKIGTNLSVSPDTFAKQLDLIIERGYITITFEDVGNGNIPTKPIILTFDDGYADFYTNAYPELKKRNMKAVSYIIVRDIDKSNYLTSSQIVELSNNNIEIGSHTVSHPDLSKTPDEKTKTELTQSKEVLEKLIGKSIISFCYPAGKFNDATINEVKSAEYIYAVTTNNKLTNFSNLLLLNRYRVNHDTNISAYLK